MFVFIAILIVFVTGCNGCRIWTMFWWNWGMNLIIASSADAKW